MKFIIIHRHLHTQCVSICLTFVAANVFVSLVFRECQAWSKCGYHKQMPNSDVAGQGVSSLESAFVFILSIAMRNYYVLFRCCTFCGTKIMVNAFLFYFWDHYSFFLIYNDVFLQDLQACIELKGMVFAFDHRFLRCSVCH